MHMIIESIKAAGGGGYKVPGSTTATSVSGHLSIGKPNSMARGPAQTIFLFLAKLRMTKNDFAVLVKLRRQ